MYSLRRILKAPFGIFRRRTLGPILGQTKGQKTLGHPAPWVFGLCFGIGCGLGFVFRKFLGTPSIFYLGSTLSTLGNLPRGSIHHATSSAFPQIVPVYSVQPTDCLVHCSAVLKSAQRGNANTQHEVYSREENYSVQFISLHFAAYFQSAVQYSIPSTLLPISPLTQLNRHLDTGG